MRRHQLVEIEDLAWCPRPVRDGGTDWLAFGANMSGIFSAAVPTIRAAMHATGTDRVLDLCSGSGGPWLTLLPELAKTGPVDVLLTDLYPNADADETVRGRSGGRLRMHPSAVDATNVPPALDGVRTMFNAFHHFPPDRARAILADAVTKRRAIAIFEGASSRALAPVAMPIQLPAIALLTPLVRPFRWSRLALTYLVPLIPLLVLFDGTMSFLRLYTEEERRELVSGVQGHEQFRWDIGSTKVRGTPFRIGHLVGVPRTQSGRGGDVETSIDRSSR